MTTEGIARLRALLVQATKRPWTAVFVGCEGDSYGVESSAWTLTDEDNRVPDEDADLIASAVNALPGLLDEVERLRAALEGMLTASYKVEMCVNWTADMREASAAIEAAKEAARAALEGSTK